MRIHRNEWVRTARALSSLVTFYDEYLPLRRANSLGVVDEDESEHGGHLLVRHSDGSRAPYVPDELAPSASFYIASKTKHAARWRALRDVGHGMPFPYGVPIVSTWIDEAGEGESTDLSDLWKRCIAEASSAAACVVYVEPGETLKGALVEVGAALASGREVRWVGTPVSQTLMSHPMVKRFETVEEALGLPAPEVAASVDIFTQVVIRSGPREPFAKRDVPTGANRLAVEPAAHGLLPMMFYRSGVSAMRRAVSAQLVDMTAEQRTVAMEEARAAALSARKNQATGDMIDAEDSARRAYADVVAKHAADFPSDTEKPATDAEWFAAEGYASAGLPAVLLRARNATYGKPASASADPVHVAALRRLVTAFDGDGPDFSEALSAAKEVLAGYPVSTVEEQLAEVRRALVAADAGRLTAEESAEDTADIAKRLLAHARALAVVARAGVKLADDEGLSLAAIVYYEKRRTVKP